MIILLFISLLNHQVSEGKAERLFISVFGPYSPVPVLSLSKLSSSEKGQEHDYPDSITEGRKVHQNYHLLQSKSVCSIGEALTVFFTLVSLRNVIYNHDTILLSLNLSAKAR